ncbi:MAG TPA: cadherin-like domain-containing protein, partial [Chloroflexi bacterium]|nr:cadherin-like domain-containing protein [Chloroflexota bacterium]
TAVTQPAHGQATLSGNKIAYTPMAGFEGDDTFSYTVSDGVNSTTGSVTVHVTASGAPQANALYLPVVTR